jgi:hypothetical protein
MCSSIPSVAAHNRLHTLTLAIASMVALASQPAYGYWQRLGPRALVRAADVIAVISIEKVTRTHVHDRWWAYGQRVTARVLHPIKGHLPKRLTIYAGEDFICSSAHYRAGSRYLVFLTDRDFLTTTDLAGGQFEIGPADGVDWLPTDPWHEPRNMSVGAVIDEVRFLLTRGPGPPGLPPAAASPHS